MDLSFEFLRELCHHQTRDTWCSDVYRVWLSVACHRHHQTESSSRHCSPAPVLTPTTLSSVFCVLHCTNNLSAFTNITVKPWSCSAMLCRVLLCSL